MSELNIFQNIFLKFSIYFKMFPEEQKYLYFFHTMHSFRDSDSSQYPKRIVNMGF